MSQESNITFLVGLLGFEESERLLKDEVSKVMRRGGRLEKQSVKQSTVSKARSIARKTRIIWTEEQKVQILNQAKELLLTHSNMTEVARILVPRFGGTPAGIYQLLWRSGIKSTNIN